MNLPFWWANPVGSDLQSLWLSVRVASMATVVIVVFGLPIAWTLARWRFPGKGVIGGLLILPLVLPPTVLGYYLLQLLGRGGWIGQGLENRFGVMVVFHPAGAVIAAAVAAFPLFLMPARAAFEEVDPDLEDAARLLGRSESSVFTSITLPLAWKGIAAGTVLAFSRALGDFGATLMVAGDIPDRTRTAPIAIYNAVSMGDSATAGRLTLALSMIAIAALWLAGRGLPAPARRRAR